ncbi:MAG: sigma-70 family RNA polymerase sigma factor [Rubripirellula sp.]
MNEVTRILSQIDEGDSIAAEKLLPLVYEELRKLAAARLANEKPGQTLQATALVHDAFIRLVDQDEPQRWDNSGHFFSAAAEAMRRILIERARQRATLKRGGDREKIAIEAVELAMAPLICDDVIGLDEALEKLKLDHPRKAELVKLRFFAGLTTVQAAEVLAVSVTTAENDWAFARSWLRVEMSGRGDV